MRKSSIDPQEVANTIAYIIPSALSSGGQSLIVFLKDDGTGHLHSEQCTGTVKDLAKLYSLPYFEGNTAANVKAAEGVSHGPSESTLSWVVDGKTHKLPVRCPPERMEQLIMDCMAYDKTTDELVAALRSVAQSIGAKRSASTVGSTRPERRAKRRGPGADAKLAG